MEIEEDGDTVKTFDFKEITQNFYGPNLRRQKRKKDSYSSFCGCVPQENKAGCGITCVSRMLQVECTPETCPCKEKCTNQRFQKNSILN